jgi:hypothetical protein
MNKNYVSHSWEDLLNHWKKPESVFLKKKSWHVNFKQQYGIEKRVIKSAALMHNGEPRAWSTNSIVSNFAHKYIFFIECHLLSSILSKATFAAFASACFLVAAEAPLKGLPHTSTVDKKKSKLSGSLMVVYIGRGCLRFCMYSCRIILYETAATSWEKDNRKQ